MPTFNTNIPRFYGPLRKELWSYEIGQLVESSPAVVEGRFVVGSNDGSVYCFGGKAK